jgi:hypothetical protein
MIIEHNIDHSPDSGEFAPRPLQQCRYRFIHATIVKIAPMLLLICAACAPRSSYAQLHCATCEVEIGVGGTYHYWARTGSLVLPVTLSWDDGRYELGVFRFTDTQEIPFPGTHRDREMANPYWGVSLSRRWRIFERGPLKGFFGFGLAGRSESDVLSSTRWDFASQIGLRFRVRGDRVVGELTMRHWSNAGIKLPNHGQDFATLTVRLNSGLFGIGQENSYAIEPSFDRERLLAANEFWSERKVFP